jgi:hypothetical protein
MTQMARRDVGQASETGFDAGAAESGRDHGAERGQDA